MYFGADYYPEHWPKERWAIDAKMMKEANINIVRLAEFAWAKLEPQKGQYDFSWLDEAIDTLSQEGIKVVIGTPTATPPKWLTDQHPDIFQKDKFGRQRGFGSRRHYCYNNPTYQTLSKEIAAIVSEHYKDHPSIVAWQIDNEFGCQDTTYCYCEHCLSAFQRWLKKKYVTIDVLNREWGTVFWSQTYRSWDEIILPAYTVCEDSDPDNHGHNPGMVLDYRRFSSDSVVEYQKLQIHEIRKVSVQPITHNLMGHFPEIDYYNLANDLDFVSWDNYPNKQWGVETHTRVAMAHDLMRGTKNKNIWVMEQQSGPCGWSYMGSTPKPGQIRLWTYQSIAHGAEAIVYFRWRACTFGAEEYWYGILDHDAVPRRRYHEVQQTGAELKGLSDMIINSKVVAEAAIIKSYDNLWSHQNQRHNYQFDYNQLLTAYYDALASCDINADVTSITNDLSKYKVVFMPAFNLMNDEIKNRIENYVLQGGTLVITFRSGTRTWNNSMSTKTMPCDLKDLAGVEVEEFDSLGQDRQASISSIVGNGTAKIWCDILKPVSSQVIATYSSDYYQGKAAITINNYGKGNVYYVGCDLNQNFLNSLVALITSTAKVSPVLPIHVDGVEAVLKEKDGRRYLMILNHNSFEIKLKVEGKYSDVISGCNVDNLLSMVPYGVAILV